jgi:SAM-dependent methyltransferase
MSLYTTIRNVPWIWWLASRARYMPGVYWLWKRCWFRRSVVHWQRHYKRGGDSGPGSYGEFASYKADLINRVVRERGIRSIIELGCGDGNQLTYLEVDQYIGLDVSKVAIQRCLARHGGNAKRSFIWYDQDYFHDPLRIVSADCAISLDVIYHLIEDDVFARYVRNLFNCARRFVIIYGLDREQMRPRHVAVRFRKYSDYIATNIPEFRIAQHVSEKEKFYDFFLYERISYTSQT